MEVIKNSEPISKKKSFTNIAITSALIFLIGLIFANFEISIILFFLSAITILLLELFDNNYYTGWTIGNASIDIKRIPLFGKLIIVKINFNEIEDITYIDGRKWGESRMMKFRTNKKTYNLISEYGIFELAGTLKYFQSTGIPVKLKYKDSEVELFLEGKIDSIPMTNDMKINA